MWSLFEPLEWLVINICRVKSVRLTSMVFLPKRNEMKFGTIVLLLAAVCRVATVGCNYSSSLQRSTFIFDGKMLQLIGIYFAGLVSSSISSEQF